jgi:ATP-dependent helicase HrpA
MRRPDLDASEVEVEVSGAEVTLSGTVNDRYTKRNLEDLGPELKPLRKVLAVNVQGELTYRKLAVHPLLPRGLAAGRELRDDLLDLLVSARFLEGQVLPRTKAQFDAALTGGKGGIGLLAQELSRCAQQSLDGWVTVQSRLRILRMPAVSADIDAQLARLLFAGFLTVTPWKRLREFPRYLKALQYRLEKAGQDVARDHKLAVAAQNWESRYWTAVKAEQGRHAPEDEDYRWLMEEHRVSLFAQQLKTAVPVSAKRLEDAWMHRSKGDDPVRG